MADADFVSLLIFAFGVSLALATGWRWHRTRRAGTWFDRWAVGLGIIVAMLVLGLWLSVLMWLGQ